MKRAWQIAFAFQECGWYLCAIMHYLYLDESGDLGHYIDSPGSSQYFAITVLEVTSEKDRKAIEKGIARTVKNKLRKKSSGKAKPAIEIKGTQIEFAIKKYFYRQVANVPFRLYSVILDKNRFGSHLQFSQRRLYRFITHLVIREIPLEQAIDRILLILDRRMGSASIREFNESLRLLLETQVPPQLPIFIDHLSSNETKSLQAVDLFSWGIFRKYEARDTEWYDVFREKIVFERLYP